jgi:hypothetical protein
VNLQYADIEAEALRNCERQDAPIVIMERYRRQGDDVANIYNPLTIFDNCALPKCVYSCSNNK